MPSPTSQPVSPGRLAFRRCAWIALVVFLYLVCGVVAPLLGNGIAGRVAWAIFGLPYDSSLIRYATGLCLLAGLIWAHSGVRRSPEAPQARRVGFFSCVLLLVTWIVLFGPAPFEKMVPWDVRWALGNPDHVVLYSVGEGRKAEFDTVSGKFLPPRDDGDERFHGREILGSVALDGKRASEAAKAFRYSLNFGSLLPASCFNPRHGLRITSGGHVYDFLLCYECQGIVVFRDGKEVVYRSASGSSVVLNALLTEAKVPLAKAPGE